MLWAALLSGIAGYVDAICYLRLGGAFAANMTGNLVEMGMKAATGDWQRALWCGSLLCAFLLGVLAARLVLQAQHSPRLALVADAAIIAVVGTGVLDGAAVPLLAAAMAIQNETVSHGVIAVNVAFITGDIQKLGERLVAETVPGRREEHGGGRVILTVLGSYAIGAAVGTLAAGWDAAALFPPAGALAAATMLPVRWTGLAGQQPLKRQP